MGFCNFELVLGKGLLIVFSIFTFVSASESNLTAPPILIERTIVVWRQVPSKFDLHCMKCVYIYMHPGATHGSYIRLLLVDWSHRRAKLKQWCQHSTKDRNLKSYYWSRQTNNCRIYQCRVRSLYFFSQKREIERYKMTFLPERSPRLIWKVVPCSCE